MEQSRIDRISELTRISRARPLTPQELEERQELRQEYLAAIRQSLTGQLEHTYIVTPDGKKHRVEPKD
ncbi:MAG: DUF896 domain-containing protein [bacterium]